jgi:hypothetical protein
MIARMADVWRERGRSIVTEGSTSSLVSERLRSWTPIRAPTARAWHAWKRIGLGRPGQFDSDRNLIVVDAPELCPALADIAEGRFSSSQACRAWPTIRPASRLHFAESLPFSWPRSARHRPAGRAPLQAPQALRLPNRAWIAGLFCPEPSETEVTSRSLGLRQRFQTVCPVLDTGTGAEIRLG